MRSWVVTFAIVAVAACQEQEPTDIPISIPAVLKRDDIGLPLASGEPRLPSGGPAEVVDSKLRDLVRAGAQTVPVFIVLRDQPHRQVLDRYERPAVLRLQILQARYSDLVQQIIPSKAELSLARSELEREMLEVRQLAFREIEAQIRPGQDEVAQLVAQLGGRKVQRYTAINMLAAEAPASAIDAIAAHPLVAEISLVEKQSAQLAVSALSLGAPVFWSAGYAGGGRGGRRHGYRRQNQPSGLFGFEHRQQGVPRIRQAGPVLCR